MQFAHEKALGIERVAKMIVELFCQESLKEVDKRGRNVMQHPRSAQNDSPVFSTRINTNFRKEG